MSRIIFGGMIAILIMFGLSGFIVGVQGVIVWLADPSREYMAAILVAGAFGFGP